MEKRNPCTYRVQSFNEHGNFIDEETAKLMVEKNAYLVPTLVAYYMISKHGKELGYPEDSIAKGKEVLKIGTNSLKGIVL